jgi:tripartite-type tricarboxylate transporter receptor subunit TctC
MFDSITNSAPHVRAGKLRALAVLMPARSPLLPDVPTAVELGFDGLEFPAWIGVFAPAAIDQSVLSRVTEALGSIMSQPDLREHFVQSGLRPDLIVGSDFARTIEANQRVAADLIKAANIPLQ